MICHICALPTEDYMICDICEEHYCEDCSYTYSLHYLFEGSRCYQCSGQYRREKLDKAKIVDNVINYLLS